MDIEQTIQKISRGTSEIISIDLLREKLLTKKKLSIKAGFDPTAPDLHLGHVVLLRKLRQFQDLGHEVIFLIGDFTAQIGDPTGKDQLRKKMDQKTIDQNAKTYKKQVFKILDPKKTKVVFNSHWLNKLTVKEHLELTTHITVAQMLARADFKKRYEDGKEISILEFIYPLLQGYDSVHLQSDIELGGTDQKFNLLMGRQLQAVYQQEPQVVIMTPLLEGTDGVKKMSKSLGNYIGINENPKEIFGKVMSINDTLMKKYYEYLTDYNLKDINDLHPKEAKLQLAGYIVGLFYDKEQGIQERLSFESTFAQQNNPDDAVVVRLQDVEDKQLIDILRENGLIESNNEGRRLIKQGAVSHEGEKILDEGWKPVSGVIKVGKRRFLKLH